MRNVMNTQASLGEWPIGDIVLDLKSRDDIPKLLVGLQYIYKTPGLRDEVFAILPVPAKVRSWSMIAPLNRGPEPRSSGMSTTQKGICL